MSGNERIAYFCRADHPVSATLSAFARITWTRQHEPQEHIPERHATTIGACLRSLDEAARRGAARSIVLDNGGMALAAWRSAGIVHLAVINRASGEAWSVAATDKRAVAQLANHAAGLLRELPAPIFTITAA